jgi:hypothetical protein
MKGLEGTSQCPSRRTRWLGLTAGLGLADALRSVSDMLIIAGIGDAVDLLTRLGQSRQYRRAALFSPLCPLALRDSKI